MLGHSVVNEFKSYSAKVAHTSRRGSGIPFDVMKNSVSELSEYLSEGDFLINCIGLTTHNIDESDPRAAEEARLLNVQFPKELASLAEETGTNVIQIATDCVFSGSKGGYVETDIRDATDVYGTSKREGEIQSARVMHIRVSIVGRELRGRKSLLEWILGQPKHAKIPGYTDRLWSGITTTAFAKIVAGIISSQTFRSGMWHLVPENTVTKFELVSLIASAFGRGDIEIVPQESGIAKDLTLLTRHPEVNLALWHAGGYRQVPTIQDLIAEMASSDATIYLSNQREKG